jgi:Bacterial-like globin
MKSMIDRIGGEPKVHELVDHFYDLIETLPQGQGILEMHLKGHGLAHVRTAQFEFLCGFFRRASILSRTPWPHEPPRDSCPCGHSQARCGGLVGNHGQDDV